MNINEDFAKWANMMSGCDGGDINARLWFCGIEWGKGFNRSKFNINDDIKRLLFEVPYRENSLNHKFFTNSDHKSTYDVNMLKLLSIIYGYNEISKEEVNGFIDRYRPFTKDSGMFKANIYPVALKNTHDAQWDDYWNELSGIKMKSFYRLWCMSNRFKEIKRWMQASNAKIVICVGKTYLIDFIQAFEGIDNLEFNNNVETENIVDNLELTYASINSGNTLLVVIPFITNKGNLIKNDHLLAFGKRIRELYFNKYNANIEEA